ncbi:uncharacterized protein L203_100491 [Cryptococcus depauperatus CBS 7841]|uniref:Uncharacterized protein n=1 Tax=Cryptococcus depauperatus CBS 7841 TaxID=1295531 RepID=A0AAJ8JN77_9TREE
MNEFFQYLLTFPEDISHSFKVPIQEQAAYTNSLLKIISESNESAKALHTVLQAATLLPPQAEFGPYGLKWAKNPRISSEKGENDIIDYLGSGLSSGVFSTEHWLNQLREVSHPNSRLKAALVTWGKRNFGCLLDSCLTVYYDPLSRTSMVQLLIDVLLDLPYNPTDTSSSTYMQQLAEHRFTEKLLHSLILDTSNYLFGLSLRLLMEAIPHTPLSITPKVPLMAIVLGRAIMWRDRPFIDGEAVGGDEFTRTASPNSKLNWRVATSTMESTVPPPAAFEPHTVTQSYLITLYGAWPSNVIAFVRDPAAYIQGKNVEQFYAVEWTKIWAPRILATRIEPLIRDFRLHPSLVLFTSSAELGDDKRWDKVNASEFTARSRALANADQNDASQLSLVDEDPFMMLPMDVTTSEGQLQKENEFLRMEARFTSRIQKQYLHHIGRLHKSCLRLNNDEAEIHSFVNRLKEQAKQITALTEQLSLARCDASLAQQRHSKWAAQQHDKVSSFRSEKATWQTEAARIRGELDEIRTVVRNQQRELSELQNQIMEAQPKIRHINDYEIRIKQLTESQRLWDQDLQRCKDAEERMETWRSKCFEASRQENARKNDVINSSTPLSPSSTESHPPKCNSASQPLQKIDLSMYIELLKDCKSRTDRLERENQELRNEIEINRKNSQSQYGSAPRDARSFIWEEPK